MYLSIFKFRNDHKKNCRGTKKISKHNFKRIQRNSSKIEGTKWEYSQYFPIKANEKYLDRRKGKFKRPAEKRRKFNDKGRTIQKRPKVIYKREDLGCKTYFCNPYCAWQKGTNENSNGLLREFYSKGMDLAEVNIGDLNYNLNLMNNRPRKRIKYKTPKEELFSFLP